MLFSKNKSKLATVVFFISTLTVPLLSQAESGGRGRPQGPPPEATKACKSLSTGDACSFSGRRGEVVGTCINPSKNEDVLACAPKDRPQGPPPEATEACKSLSTGDACSFSGRRGEVVGTCIKPSKNEDVLACTPKGGPRH